MKNKKSLYYYTVLISVGVFFCSSAQAATQIYRSVGPTNVDDLNTAHETVTISGTTATFSDAMPNNVGVGDVLQYDISGTVYLAFINGRTSSSVFSVQSSTGGAPHSASATQVVNVYRAYTSLSNAEAGIESTAIDSTVANFDDWTAGGVAATDDVGNDLVANDLQWNVACYGDAEDDTTGVVVQDWTTDADNFLKIYTPYLATEVGVSQRHSGVWSDSAYRLVILDTDFPGGSTIGINPSGSGPVNVWIDGLEIFTNSAFMNYSGIEVADVAGVTKISNNIIKTDPNGTSSSGVRISSLSAVGNYQVWNNIIYNFLEGGITLDVSDGTLYAYSNTVYGIVWGDYCFNSVSGTFVAKNNIAQNCATGFLGDFDAESDYNLSDLVDAPGISDGHFDSINSTTLNFTSLTAGSENFHLSASDSEAINAGMSLSADTHLNFSTDIDLETRTGSWDIGADEYPLELETVAPVEPTGLAVS